MNWTDPDFRDFAGWNLGSGEFGYETESGYEPFLRTTVPVGATSIYLRGLTSFKVDDRNNNGTVADEFDRVYLEALYDDGFVAYLNGVPVLRVNAPDTPTYDSIATATHEATGDYEVFELGPDAMALLRPEPQKNVLAIHALNDSDTSPDFLMGFRLISQKTIGDPAGPDGLYYTLDGSDPRLPGGELHPAARKYQTSPFPIDDNMLVRARIRLAHEWSPLVEAYYQVTPPSIAITEINYHPHDPSDLERTQLPNADANDFEFLEIYNHGTRPVNLNGLQLTSGVQFTFPSEMLDAGQHAVVVKNATAFQLRYGSEIRILGEFESGSLANGGERLELQDALEQPLISFGYGDRDPWPQRADGFGGTLTLIDPQTTKDQYGKANRWHGSTNHGGTPGTASLEPVGIVINEIVSNPDAVYPRDAIELLNVSHTAIDLGGWFLSDSGSRPLKYRLPDGTQLDPGQSIIFDETHFNPTPPNPGPDHFALAPCKATMCGW